MIIPFLLLALQAPTHELLRTHQNEWQRLIAAEDARAATPAQLRTILDATRSRNAELRRLAVRALGRLERSELRDSIAPHLKDADPAVRGEAAHALAQSVVRDSTTSVLDVLGLAMSGERSAGVVAALAESAGRVYQRGSTAARSAMQLSMLLAGSDTVRHGAARGLFFLARQRSVRDAFTDPVRQALLSPAVWRTGAGELAVRTRTVAAATLASIGALERASIAQVMSDAHPMVRREGAAALATADTTGLGPLVVQAMRDSAAAVRYHGLRAYGLKYALTSCSPIYDLLDDAGPHVALQAIDLAGSACRAHPEARQRITPIAQRVSSAQWHRPAHAIVALARIDAEAARPLARALAAHRSAFARTYAANAAGLLKDTALLLQLSRDAAPNVRTAAVEALAPFAGRAADTVYLAQFSQDDSQLLMAATAALRESPDPRVPVVLLNALDRISAQKSETSRDARMALLQRIRDAGNPALAARVRPYLTDFDPRVAALAAQTLAAWTGERASAAPSAPPPLPLPTFAQATELANARVTIEFDEGTVELLLFPFDAPTNAHRFARLARAGFFNGLTLHRIAPNFVVQGGSPNANEYSGDKPFSRDELGLNNWRGTVGLSTRGRDTGDGQLYINLIDNVRLDHDYTVFAAVVRGLDVVDRLVEGAVMRRVSVTR